MSVESEIAIKEIERKVDERKQVSRIVSNALAMLNDMDIKGQYSRPMAEVLGWLEALLAETKKQLETLEATLPKKEEVVKAAGSQLAEVK